MKELFVDYAIEQKKRNVKIIRIRIGWTQITLVIHIHIKNMDSNKKLMKGKKVIFHFV